jgi:hypothetical protein
METQLIECKRVSALAVVNYTLLVSSVERTGAHAELLRMAMACNQQQYQRLNEIPSP